MRDLAEGKIARRFMHEFEVVTHLARTTCTLNKEIRQLQRWLLSALPDTASQYLFPEPGKLVTAAVEGLLVQDCKKIHHYVVHWNRTHNGKCYNTFPVTSPDLTSTHFLELRQRRLSSIGLRRPCNETPTHEYITDKHNNLWSLLNGNFHKIPKYDWKMSRKQVRIIKIGTFSQKLIHYEQNSPLRTTLLEILNSNHQNLD